jgi:hypothetical protein
MSQSTAVRSAARAPRPGPRPQPPRQVAPRLRVVTAPRHTRSRAGLVAACVALLVLGLVGLLLLNVNLERGTYDLRDQASRAEQLREQKQRLEVELRQLQSPGDLYDHAHKLGMVDGPAAPVFVEGGKTLGVPTPAPTPPRPTVTQQASPSVTTSAPTARTGRTSRTSSSASASASASASSSSAASSSRRASSTARPTATPHH